MDKLFGILLIIIAFFAFWALIGVVIGHFWKVGDGLEEKSIYKKWKEKKEKSLYYQSNLDSNNFTEKVEQSSDVNNLDESSGNQYVFSTGDLIFSLGDVVSHKTYGLGTIIKAKGSGNSLQLKIEFKEVSEKWLLADNTKLKII